MASKLLRATLKLNMLETEPVYIVRSITPRYEYDKKGVRTEKIVGYVYDCINTASYEQYNVAVEEDSPAMDPQELLSLREGGEKVCVTLENARIRAYFSSRTGTYEDSVRADKVCLLDTYA